MIRYLIEWQALPSLGRIADTTRAAEAQTDRHAIVHFHEVWCMSDFIGQDMDMGDMSLATA